jgi:hypothetical protein
MNAKFALTALVLSAGFAGSAFAETPTVVTDSFHPAAAAPTCRPSSPPTARPA